MTREQAVLLATEIVEKMGNTPELNNRGYKIDGWRPPTVTERVDAIVKLAETLVGPPTHLVPPADPGQE